MSKCTHDLTLSQAVEVRTSFLNFSTLCTVPCPEELKKDDFNCIWRCKAGGQRARVWTGLGRWCQGWFGLMAGWPLVHKLPNQAMTSKLKHLGHEVSSWGEESERGQGGARWPKGWFKKVAPKSAKATNWPDPFW